MLNILNEGIKKISIRGLKGIRHVRFIIQFDLRECFLCLLLPEIPSDSSTSNLVGKPPLEYCRFQLASASILPVEEESNLTKHSLLLGASLFTIHSFIESVYFFTKI